MKLESLKSNEMPVGIKVVMADDEESRAAWTNKAWVSLLQAEPSLGTPEVISATSGDNLLAQAIGLMDRPADVVVLDDNYESNYHGWEPTEGMLSLLAQKRGVAFEPIKKPDRGGWSVSGEMPDDLYFPNSTHFALFLRYLGFSGQIIVASSSPPNPDYIARETHSLNDYIRQFGAQVGEKPITGVVTKPSREDICSYAAKVGKWGWDYKKIKVEEYSEAFQALVSIL